MAINVQVRDLQTTALLTRRLPTTMAYGRQKLAQVQCRHQKLAVAEITFNVRRGKLRVHRKGSILVSN